MLLQQSTTPVASKYGELAVAFTIPGERNARFNRGAESASAREYGSRFGELAHLLAISGSAADSRMDDPRTATGGSRVFRRLDNPAPGLPDHASAVLPPAIQTSRRSGNEKAQNKRTPLTRFDCRPPPACSGIPEHTYAAATLTVPLAGGGPRRPAVGSRFSLADRAPPDAFPTTTHTLLPRPPRPIRPERVPHGDKKQTCRPSPCLGLRAPGLETDTRS